MTSGCLTAKIDRRFIDRAMEGSELLRGMREDEEDGLCENANTKEIIVIARIIMIFIECFKHAIGFGGPSYGVNKQ